MTDCFEDFLKKQDVKSEANFCMSRYSSIGIGGVARLAIMPDSEEKLIKTIDFLTEKSQRFKILGRMTNVLPCDSEYDGVLIITSNLNSFSVTENIVYAECGVSFSKLLRVLSEKSLGGAEALFGIPGSVGGMIFSNAGAYNREISDFVKNVRIYFPKERKIAILDRSDMQFSYRNQKFKGTDAIFLGATFCFDALDASEISGKLSEIISLRKSSQPYGEMSLGSIFKRNKGRPVSMLIDKLGFKGARVGGAMVSQKHAGFIINVGGASAMDVKLLISRIKNAVYHSYGFIPEEEIEYL